MRRNGTRALSEQLRSIGSHSSLQAAAFEKQVAELAERTRDTDRAWPKRRSPRSAARRNRNRELRLHRSALAKQTRNLRARSTCCSTGLSTTLEEICAAISTQSAAVAALVEQASAGLGKAGMEAAESLAINVERANSSLDGLSHIVAEQHSASQSMIAEIDARPRADRRTLQRTCGARRRARQPLLASLTRARTELDTLAAYAGSQDEAIGSSASAPRHCARASSGLRPKSATSSEPRSGEAQGGTDRLAEAAADGPPEVGGFATLPSKQAAACRSPARGSPSSRTVSPG